MTITDYPEGTDHHFFHRDSQKIKPPADTARTLMTTKGHHASSIGKGKATFIEKTLITRFASMIATVQMVNFLMSWLRLWLTIDARVPMRLLRTCVWMSARR